MHSYMKLFVYLYLTYIPLKGNCEFNKSGSRDVTHAAIYHCDVVT